LHGIIRVFPRKTKATPDDALAFTGAPTKDFLEILEQDSDDKIIEQAKIRREVHISTTFTYDIPKAEQLAEDWHKAGFNVKIGGPAFNTPSGDFTPGLYLKEGYVITSRGCNNNCWFCSAWRREGSLRELPIRDGWIINDDNILACSERHIRAVFEMLSRQEKRPVFSGGLDSRLLSEWHVDLLREAKTERMCFANDDESDLEPLVHAERLLRNGGIIDSSGHKLKCYVLIGYPDDTMANAEKRLLNTWRAGFWPYAMLYHDEKGEVSEDWRRFQRTWARPQIVYHKLKETSDRYF
jgi:hypothetical protein